jgi:hypothetical protein
VWLHSGASTSAENTNASTTRNTKTAKSSQRNQLTSKEPHPFVFVANLSQHTPPGDPNWPGAFGVVNSDSVEQACVDLEALLLQLLRAQRIDSPMRVQVSVASKENRPLKCAVPAYDTTYHFAAGAPTLPRLRPVTVEVPAGATEEQTKPAAAELAAGILNQFGLGCQSQRYR